MLLTKTRQELIAEFDDIIKCINLCMYIITIIPRENKKLIREGHEWLDYFESEMYRVYNLLDPN